MKTRVLPLAFLLFATAATGAGCSSPSDLACPDGTWDHDSNAATACVAWTTCEPGSFVAANGSSSNDRVCAGCGSGTFSAGVNAGACGAWTTCEPGSFVARAGGAESDQVCAACPDGTQSQSANQSACTRPDECAAGSVQVEPATTSRPPVCAACEGGTHCAGGSSPKAACADGMWDHDTNPATACVARSHCIAGTFVAQDGSATRDRTCEACAAGTFSTTPNVASCQAWSACAPGEVVSVEGSATSERACIACAAGTWDDDANPVTACVEWSDCEPGEYLSAAGSAASDRACVACGAGHSSLERNAAMCFAVATAVESSGDSTCALLGDGRVKCWGANNLGQLGLGDKASRGTSPGGMGKALPAVDLGSGRTATAVSVGLLHACALLDDGQVKCWGRNAHGQLGQGDASDRGDAPGEMGDALPAIDLGTGRTATAIAAGMFHSCALLDDGQVKCWGANDYGLLGVGDTSSRGGEPGQMGDALPAVDLGTGRTATAIAVGALHSCALLDDASVKCWGASISGELGLGDTSFRGDEPGEMGDALPAVDLGAGRTVKALAAGTSHTCAVLDDGQVKCWGNNLYGQLGQGDEWYRGDGPGEMGDALPAVDLGAGRSARAVRLSESRTCALLDDGSVKCWGDNSDGALGLGDTQDRGDGPGEMGDALPAIDLGTGHRATALGSGLLHNCAVLGDGRVKCWGGNSYGQLGLGDAQDRGEELGEMGDALPVVDLGARP